MDTQKETSIADAIINGLKKATVELEEFRVQVALGKAEAHDAYEDAKKKLNHILHDTAQRFTANGTTTKDVVQELTAMFQTLQVQLALGKAETREVFEAQRLKISHALQRLEKYIENTELVAELKETLHREIHKFNIKLEILKLRYELNKIAVHEEFEIRKDEFSKTLDAIAGKLRAKEMKAEQKWEHFRDEITEAYNGMKKTFVG